MTDEAQEFREGLEDVYAAETQICKIDGLAGRLIYAGYDIRELAENISFEECCYLLWNLRLPNQSELDELREDLDRAAELPSEVLSVLKSMTPGATSMAMLRTGVSMLAHFDHSSEDRSEKALRKIAISLTARMPMLVASFDRLRRGKEPVPYQKGLGAAERFLYQLKGELPGAEACKAMDMALVLHAEHGFNASTFAARVTVSTLSDMYSAISSAVGTLKGPLHGGANERVIAMLEQIGTVDQVEDWIGSQLSAKKRIYGFGHRVYKTMDPRALFLKKMSQQLAQNYGQTQWYDMSERIEGVVKAKKGIDANVDFYSASVYHTIGIPSDLFTPIFAIARIAGWTAHVMEQLRNNRLIRPRAHYVGPTDQKFIPIEDR